MAINLDHVTQQIAVTDTATDADLTLVSKGTGVVNLNTGNGTAVRVADFGGAVVAGLGVFAGSSAQNTVYVSPYGSGAGSNLLLASKGTGFVILATNTSNNSTGNEQARISHTASAVNYVNLTGSVTGNTAGPIISAQGSDTDVPLSIRTKNAGAMIFTKARSATTSNTYLFENAGGLTSDGNGGAFWRGLHAGAPLFSISGSNKFPRIANYFELDSTTDPTVKNTYYAIGNSAGINLEANFANESGAGFRWRNSASSGPDISFRIAPPLLTHRNYLEVDGAATGLEPTLSAQGSDTDVSVVFRGKGTGAIDLAAGSSGVNISNGGTVTAITRTAGGSLYTGFPSIVISAPTTAGGVQATATVTQLGVNNATVQSGGTGYTNGDVLTIVGGTPAATTPKLTVTGVSGGVITSVSVDFQTYTAIPTSPVSVTGGTGSSATFNLTYFVPSGIFSITNAGSGYVEQPTVTFSGGGGSGAAAYARIGSTPVFKSLASGLDFSLPTGNILRLTDSTNNAVNYWQLSSSATGVQVGMSAVGNDASVGTNFTTKGSAGHVFSTNSFGSVALVLTHTASAVNYVNITGAATGGRPAISAQGSDTNIDLSFAAKGTGNQIFSSGGGTLLTLLNTANAVNYPQIYPAATGAGPAITWTGSDAAVVGVYNTKGAGAHLFYTNSNPQVRISDTASAVNYLQLTGSSTGGSPVISTQGSDTNISMAIGPKGTGILYLGSGGQTRITGGGANTLFLAGGSSGVNYIQISNAPSSFSPSYIARGSDANVGLSFGTYNDANIDFYASGDPNAGTGKLQVRIAPISSAVNYLQLNGSVTGQLALIQTAGSDASVGLELRLKGTPVGPGFRIANNNGSNVCFSVQTSVSAPANYHQMQPANAGSGPNIAIAGSDTNIDMNLVPKGTGNINAGTNFANYHQLTGSATGFGVVHSAQGSDTNIPLVLQPKGTGALQAQQTDSTATGGNARGAYATDLQKNRSNANQVADGTACVITGGINNRSSGNYNFVGGGQSNTAIYSNGVIVGGIGNTLVANSAFIGGGVSNTISFGIGTNWSFIGAGDSNNASGVHNIVVGGFTNSGTASAAVTTQSATMNGTTAVTLSGSNASIKVGQAIYGTSIADETYVAAISGTSLTLSRAASGSSTSTLSFFTPHGVVVGGGNNQATGSYSFIGGGGDAGTAGNRNVASGDWSTVAGGWANRATGTASTIAGGGTFGGAAAGNLASGTSSFVSAGWSNTASGNASSVLSGASNQSQGTFSAVLSGTYGLGRLITGHTAIAASDNPMGTATLGGSQSGILVLARQTTDATPTVLASTSNTAGTGNQVILPNNSAYFFTGEVVAGVTGGGNTKGWTIEGVIKRGANAASTALVGTPTVTSMYADVGAATWTIAVTADTTNGGLAVTFTGQLATTIRCVAQIRTTEMTF